MSYFFFFFNDTATTEIYTLSLHDALPISLPALPRDLHPFDDVFDLEAPEDPLALLGRRRRRRGDRKSTRLNSSHGYISYAVFCLKKKKNRIQHIVHSTTLQLTPVRLRRVH